MEGRGVPGVSSSHVSCFHFVLAKRKRHRRRAKAWKEKECYASLPRASPVSITLLPNGRGTGDARRHGRKRSPTRLFLARLLFPFRFSQAEEAQETREGLEGKGVLRVSSSRVSRFHYPFAKRKRHGRRAKAWKEKESHASLPRTSPVSISF